MQLFEHFMYAFHTFIFSVMIDKMGIAITIIHCISYFFFI